jgi:CTP-dependent riboflavin kinase
MAKLIELLEAELSDKVTSRAKITFEDLLKAIYEEVGPKKVANYNLKNIAKKLGITTQVLKRYYQKAKDEGFITKSDTIAKKYLKQIEKDVKKSEVKKDDNSDAELKGNSMGSKAKSAKLSKIGKGQLKKFVAPK